MAVNAEQAEDWNGASGRSGHALGVDFSRIQVAEARRLAARRWRR